MIATKKSLGHIFDPNIRLMVPLFQRPYVWEQEKNWEPLWESIHDVAERRLNGGTQRPHFLGAVVLEPLQASTGDITARQVIDGQQRMTTFQVSLAATRDLCRSLGDEPFSRKFATLTSNDSSLCDQPDDVFKVWPTTVDQSDFRNVMTAESCEEVCKRFKGKPNAKHLGADNRIANAYLYFYRTFAEWLKGGENFGERLRALYQTIKDDMQVVVIDLDERDDPQVIFETLNNFGTRLLPADLIKNFLLRLVEDNQQLDLHRRYWLPFDEPSFWRAEVGQGRLKRPRIDQFLQHYLTLVKGDEVPAPHLFAEFRDYARNNPTISAADHLRSLHTYGGIFEKFRRYDETSREGQFFHRLEGLEITTFFPLLLEVFKSAEQHSPDEITTVLTDLESFVIRRMVCDLETKGYNTLVRSLIQKLRASDRFSADAIREFLLRQNAESTRWPTDKEFERAWVGLPVYKRARGRVRIVLEALELALHTGKSERVKIESKLTIEHVMPQEWVDHWPLPKDMLPEEAKERRNRLIHTFGNLTLVTGKLNPSMSNSSWETKKKALSEHGTFALNRKLCGLDAWDDGAIEHRAAELFHFAMAIWPKPATLVNPKWTSETARAFDPRSFQSLLDMVDHSEQFAARSKKDRKSIARMTDNAVRMLWSRTGARQDAFAPGRTDAECLDFISRHPRVLECVKHIYQENHGNGIGQYFSLAYCSALMYLMASRRSDGDEYRLADPRSERTLRWDDWDKACDFWLMFSNGSPLLHPVRRALDPLRDPTTGADVGSRQERVAIFAKAWNLFVEGQVITDDAVKLKYVTDTDGRHLAESASFGGIDIGENEGGADTEEGNGEPASG